MEQKERALVHANFAYVIEILVHKNAQNHRHILDYVLNAQKAGDDDNHEKFKFAGNVYGRPRSNRPSNNSNLFSLHPERLI